MGKIDSTELALKAPVTRANLKHHVFVCTGTSCSKNDSEQTLAKFWEVLAERGLLYGKRGSMEGSVIVTTCGSIGLCQIGPAVMIYPEGIWYYGVTSKDVTEIVDEHLINGRIVERLLAYQF
ncbi:MAG TPA: (2Fe-2S) ferredoxin domain-containing protein [Coleofasciculaceae cyanobacterium]|jgi:(2Fe-2S) ferredoxin